MDDERRCKICGTILSRRRDGDRTYIRALKQPRKKKASSKARTEEIICRQIG